MTFKTRICLALALPFAAAVASDWPAYRHDFARSGVSPDTLPAALHRQWTYAARHKPMPAWPEPGRELNRLDFDYVFQPVVAAGVLYFGSSADHKVYAMDLKTGQERWSFFTEAPVRFAPAVDAGRVFVASDDGWVYCLSAKDGKQIWRFFGGPRQERMMGNGRMMSRWPLRSGVAVDKGVVYIAAGMWPSEGVYLFALRADDGTVLWENGTSGTLYVQQPHPGSFAMTGVSPQGIVLGNDRQLLVPTGRNVPAVFDRATGKLVYYRSSPSGWGNRWGGCWNMLAKGYLIGWKAHVSIDITRQLGEFKPDRRDGLVVFNAKTGKELREINGPLRAVVNGNTIYTAGAGKVQAFDLDGWVKGKAKPKWEAPHGRAYEMIMAGNTLAVAGPGTVTTFDAATGAQLWQDQVEGEVRGLAAADGRLIASTTEGAILCYGPQAVEAKVVRRGETSPAANGAAALAKRILAKTGKRAGLCLALGAGDGALLRELARQSDLTIYCVEPDAKKVDAARKMLDAAGLYGVRVAVHQGALDKLGYPDLFADLIVTGTGEPIDMNACSAKEVYRVLRPYGGVVCASLGRAQGLSRWLAAGGVPQAEIAADASGVLVKRGALPGAGHWSHQYASAGRAGASTDDRARLPLKMLWFGEPGPAQLVTRHWGGPAPLCVNGRMFVIGQFSIIATDAYNGRQLWTRDFGKTEVGWHPVRRTGSAVAADDDSVYVLVGRECLRLDAGTGKTLQTYALPSQVEGVANAGAMRWRYLAVANGRLVGLMGGGDGKCIIAFSKGGQLLWTRPAKGAINLNSLSTDGERIYCIDATSAGEVSRARKRGLSVKTFAHLVALDAATGAVVWQTDQGIAGRDALWLSDGVLVATSRGAITGYDAANGKKLYERPASVRRFPVIAGGTIYIEPVAYDLRTGASKSRANPFTGEKTAWSYQRSYGCGAISGGRNVLMFRSGTLGIYDLAGDGGVHNVGGIRAGCYVNAIAAGGLILAPPSDAGCTCSYSLRTTVALAPSTAQRDWSIFYARLPQSVVRQAALNLGALGDRRDAEKKVWLAMPRPATRSHRRNIAVPFRFSFAPGFGKYRVNAQRVRIAGTDLPWLYASGLKGVQRAELDLDILARGYQSWPCAPAPKVDGDLSDACWDGYHSALIAAQAARVTLRHDDKRLYLAYAKPKPAGRPWRASTKGHDAPVWQDDSFEVCFSNAPISSKTAAKKYLHIGASASGARYDALWTHVTPTLPPWNIPRVDVAIDGKPDEWADQGAKVLSLTGPFRGRAGAMRKPWNFNPSFRIGWNDDGLVMLINVKDNVVHEWGNAAKLWLGDSVRLFLAPKTGMVPSYQCVITPGKAPEFQGRIVLLDNRKDSKAAKLVGHAAGGKTRWGYFVEVLLPWSNLGVAPAVGAEFAMQVFATDDDMKGASGRFTTLWHPAGDPFRDPFAYQTFRLANEPSPPVDFRPKAQKWVRGMLLARGPHAIPVQLPSLGANREDPAFDAQWTSAVRADDRAFQAEVAIPWATLAEAGLDRSRLMLNVSSRGPLKQAPKLGAGFERLVTATSDMTQPRTLSLRLHFAELEDVRPGERVFDVKVQGKTVLKDFDVVKAAGGRNRAVVRQIDGVSAARAITLEFVPKAKVLTERTAPIVSAIEIITPPQPGRP